MICDTKVVQLDKIYMCTTSLSPFLAKFTQTLELILLDNPHKAAVLSVGCASFSSTLFPFTQLSVNMLAMHVLMMQWIINIVNYCENTRYSLNNTDNLYIVAFMCLLYLFYHLKCLSSVYLSISLEHQEFATSVTGSVGFLCEGAL